MRELNRAQPLLPVTAVKTYEIRQPLATHFRPATCAEVNCQHHLKGWRTRIEKILDADGKFEHAVRTSGRRFTEIREEGAILFVFPAGQRCFKAGSHRLALGREPFYLVRGGDFRGNPRGENLTHSRAAHWVEDFAIHQGTIADAIRRG